MLVDCGAVGHGRRQSARELSRLQKQRWVTGAGAGVGWGGAQDEVSGRTEMRQALRLCLAIYALPQ